MSKVGAVIVAGGRGERAGAGMPKQYRLLAGAPVVRFALESFARHPAVINGCSELFAKIWGEDNGIGVRSAVGMGSLPDNIPVEIEALFELHG